MKPVFKNVSVNELQALATQEVRASKPPQQAAQKPPTPNPVISPAASAQPSSQAAQRDSRYVEVGDILPSKCIVYTEKALSVRPFEILEINKIHRALAEKTIRHEVDALSACLSASAYDLTLGDFYWLMYWEYLNSYKRLPKTLKWTCNSEAHEKRIADLELDVSTLNQTTEITNSQLKETPLDVEKVNNFAESFFKEFGLYLDLPRVSDLVETENDEDSDTEWFNKYAALISRKHYGKDIKTRRDYLRGFFNANKEPEVLVGLEEWAELSQHGVKEKFEVQCKECGAIQQVELLITPLSFLPASKARNG